MASRKSETWTLLILDVTLLISTVIERSLSRLMVTRAETRKEDDPGSESAFISIISVLFKIISRWLLRSVAYYPPL